MKCPHCTNDTMLEPIDYLLDTNTGKTTVIEYLCNCCGKTFKPKKDNENGRPSEN